jgi:sugar phosphate isomerase/epimerase
VRIGLAGWSLHRRFHGGELTLPEYPAIVKKEFDLSICEMNSPFFEFTDDGYIAELRARLEENGVECVHISVDGAGDLGSTDETSRSEAVANHLDWFRICKGLGCGSFRANTGGGGEPNEDNLAACTKSFAELAREGERQNVNVCIENHGGISGNPDWVVRIMTEVGGSRIRTCPDFGNFPEEIRYEGLAKIAPYAGVVHAKFYEFDESGEDTRIDAGRCMGILKEAGFDGDILIEFEGAGDDHDGVAGSIDLIRRHM